MLENSIDAGSTAIDILVKDGGLKLLQIVDNGSGISKDDLPILCQRFTTSKLREFEDLSKLTTYGFRGEALSSISHIAHLTVTTKIKDSPCAWKQTYNDGKPATENPTPIAGKNGTMMVVEDLFYNVPSRRRVFKSSAEEYGKVLDVISRYAIHCTQASFSCKKYGDSHPSLIVSASTAATSSKKKAPQVDRIRQIYGSSIANELIEVNVPPKPEYGFLGGKGQITSANYSAKKSISPVFFINHRSVASDPLRRALLQGVYAQHLPKGGHAFVYLSLEFDTRNLDVNIHPTKREVRFLYEDEIIDHICSSVQEVLAAQGSSRTFQTQTILASSGIARDRLGGTSGVEIAIGKRTRSVFGESQLESVENEENREILSVFSQPQPKKRQENRLVRTDSQQQTLPTLFRDSMYQSEPSKSRTTNKLIIDEDDVILEEESSFGIPKSQSSFEDNENNEAETESTTPSVAESDQIKEILSEIQSKSGPYYGSKMRYVDRSRVDVRLRSIKELKKEVEEGVHSSLTQVFSDHTYIGVVDYRRRLAAFQHKVQMFIVDYGTLSQAIFYQSALAEFSNLGTITLNSGGGENDDPNETRVEQEYSNVEVGIKISDLLDRETSTYDEERIASLWNMREMLGEYFSIKFIKGSSNYFSENKDDEAEENEGEDGDPVEEFWSGRIKTLPMILKGYTPPIIKLPVFLDRLLTQITFEDEKECFRSILQELARFYAPEPVLDDHERSPSKDDEEEEDDEDENVIEYRAERRRQIADSLEHYIFPAVKQRLLAPEGLLKDVVEIANLPGLYKVFERC